jgi:hypothetical protein
MTGIELKPVFTIALSTANALSTRARAGAALRMSDYRILLTQLAVAEDLARQAALGALTRNAIEQLSICSRAYQTAIEEHPSLADMHLSLLRTLTSQLVVVLERF